MTRRTQVRLVVAQRRAALVSALTAVAVAVSTLLAVPTLASTAAVSVRPVHLTSFEQRLLHLMNSARSQSGLRPLTIAPCAEDFARRWTQAMARRDVLAHNPALKTIWAKSRCRDASLVAENIGLSGTDPDAAYAAYMSSPQHRANILNPRLHVVGIGSWRRANGQVFNTVDFSNGGSLRYGTVRQRGQGLSGP